MSPAPSATDPPANLVPTRASRGGNPGRPAREGLAVALLAACLLIIARSVVFVWFEQSDFDSDQAIVGLMAKHLAEGRAFPLFQYGQDYALMFEAWLVAPVFLAAGPSVAALKGTVLFLNVVTGTLLLVLLARETRLHPGLSLAAALFFLFPPPITAATLTQALGVNIEPLLFVLLLWVTRRRPVAFGLILAVGFLVREFTVYGLAALLVIDGAEGRLFTRAGLRRYGVAGLAFAATWGLVGTIRPWSSPLGPGSAWTAKPGGSTNLDVLAGMFAFQLDAFPGHVRAFATEHLPNLFGARPVRLAMANVNSTVVQGAAWLWPVLAGALVLAAAVAAWRLRENARAARPDEGGSFAIYLVLTGTFAAAMYVTGRGPRMSLHTQRYILLTLFLPVGLTALYFSLVRSRAARAAMLGVILAWSAVGLRAHAQLAEEYAYWRPRSDYRMLADYLVATRVRYGIADYWTAYHVTFLATERVKLATTGFPRVLEYEQLYDTRRSEIVTVTDQPCAGGVQVRRWYLCGPG